MTQGLASTQYYTDSECSNGRCTKPSAQRRESEADRPLSEVYRIIAKKWVELDGAARMLEETKSAVLSQMMKALGDKPAAHAERDVKASGEWKDFIASMVEARTKANLAKVQLEYIRMQFNEWQSLNATSRAELRMSR